MSFEIVNPLTDANWDDKILGMGDADFYHSSAWARVLCLTYGYKPLYFVIRKGECFDVVLPILEIDSVLTGKRGVSLPFTDFCRPLIRKKTDLDELLQHVIMQGKERGWKCFEYRGESNLGESLISSSIYYEHELPLTDNIESLFSAFHQSHKRNISKAGKVGIEVAKCESLHGIKEFYRLNVLTRKKHGLPPQPFSFFKNVHRLVLEKGLGALFLARYQGEAVAGVISFHFGKKATYKFGASNRKYQNTGANNLAMWKALEWYCKNGEYNSFHFGRTEIGNNGLRQFKNRWGAFERKTHYSRFSFTKREASTKFFQVDGWHRNFFKMMPTPLLELCGTILYRHVG